MFSELRWPARRSDGRGIRACSDCAGGLSRPRSPEAPGHGVSTASIAQRGSASTNGTAPAPAKRDPWALQPIPDFRALVADAVKAAREQHVGGCFASIDVGVVCDVASVRTIGHLLHQRVQAKLGPVRTGAAPAA